MSINETSVFYDFKKLYATQEDKVALWNQEINKNGKPI